MRRPETAPLPAGFMARWGAWYPDAPPVGFLLREAYVHRWLRIHSLPASKRYPESDHEYAELTRRHNAVASDLLGDGARCAVVILDTCGGQRSSELGADSGLGAGPLPRIAPLSAALHDEDDGVFAEAMCLFGFATRWEPGAFDAFIVAAAEDKVRGLLVELDRGQVYAPYDGGADLILASDAARDAARDRHGAWLSADPSGL